MVEGLETLPALRQLMAMLGHNNWLRVLRRQKLLAAVIRKANCGIRERGSQKNAWHSRTDVGRGCA
jgi:hypothetical protein